MLNKREKLNPSKVKSLKKLRYGVFDKKSSYDIELQEIDAA